MRRTNMNGWVYSADEALLLLWEKEMASKQKDKWRKLNKY